MVAQPPDSVDCARNLTQKIGRQTHNETDN